MTFANSDFGRFVAVEVKDLLKQRGTDLLLKESIRARYAQWSPPTLLYSKLADFGEPGAEWASQPIRMTRIKARGSQLFSDHELLTQAQSILKPR